MSDIRITVETVGSIYPHPNADRLEIAHVLGTQTIILKGEFQPGDRVVFFPPDILLPSEVSQELGVQQYLKHALWDGEKCQCRVAACRLRGIPSYGFLAPVPKGTTETDLTDFYRARKYEPPVKLIMGGDQVSEPYNFPRYTSIEHYYRYAHTLPAGTPVKVTEKLHGTNARLGAIYLNGRMEFICGSHRTAQKEYQSSGHPSLYWRPLTSVPELQTALQELSIPNRDVIIYGEIIGLGVQDMDYGIKHNEIGFRVFDINIDGHYLDRSALQIICTSYHLPVVPPLYVGPFDPNRLEEWTNGLSTIDLKNSIRCKFKGREGCVITPLVETYHPDIGRVILKSVSVDYLARKGAKDNG